MGPYYCDFCERITTHSKLSLYQYRKDVGDSGAMGILDEFGKYSGLFSVLETAQRFMGVNMSRCTECGAFMISPNDPEHYFTIVEGMNEQYLKRKHLEKNPDMLEKVRNKYNKNLLK